MTPILIADDDSEHRTQLNTLLTPLGYEPLFVSSEQEVLALATLRTPDLIIVGMQVFGTSGSAACRWLRTHPETAELPILLVVDETLRLSGLEAGADDIIVQPFSDQELTARVRILTRLNRYRCLYAEQEPSEQQVQDTLDATLEMWVRALDLRDRETSEHTQHVIEMTLRIAERMGFAGDDLRHLRRGALLHDIGKLGIPERILLKPGPLTPEERALVQRHPTYAYEWLSSISYLRPALAIPYSHHERWDGSGYPQGSRTQAIPLEARIFAVADVWDSLTTVRPYRPAWTDGRARQYIYSLSGIQFDPEVIEIFRQL